MCTIPKKKPHECSFGKPKYPPFCSKWWKFIGRKKVFLKRGHVWACFKDNFVLINHGLQINFRKVIKEKIQNYSYKNSCFYHDVSRFNYENQINLNLIFPFWYHQSQLKIPLHRWKVITFDIIFDNIFLYLVQFIVSCFRDLCVI